ncbi:MAG: hypothetical protein ACYDEY_12295 [Acidimicrobiales bacterium]
MTVPRDHRRSRVSKWRLPRRLDKLVESGRLAAEEADRLRAAEPSGQAEVVLAAIRARHAAASLQVAVDAGRLSREEADGILEQIRSGEHSPELRAQVRRLAQDGEESPDVA